MSEKGWKGGHAGKKAAASLQRVTAKAAADLLQFDCCLICVFADLCQELLQHLPFACNIAGAFCCRGYRENKEMILISSGISTAASTNGDSLRVCGSLGAYIPHASLCLYAVKVCICL